MHTLCALELKLGAATFHTSKIYENRENRLADLEISLCLQINDDAPTVDNWRTTNVRYRQSGIVITSMTKSSLVVKTKADRYDSTGRRCESGRLSLPCAGIGATVQRRRRKKRKKQKPTVYLKRGNRLRSGRCGTAEINVRHVFLKNDDPGRWRGSKTGEKNK